MNARSFFAAASAVALIGSPLLAPTVLLSPAAATGARQCSNGDVVASYVPGGSAAGSRYGRIRLTNVSRQACRTGGYSGVSYVGEGNGTRIGHPAIRTRAASEASHVLQPGQRLVSTLQQVEAGNYPRATCHPVAVDGFRIYVPNVTRSQYVKHATRGCRNMHVHLLYERPLKRP